ncbi:MAG: hypothetical protein FWE71_08450 [Nocardioidaceae bacterium]|nr:hypothetical protein [Nocardioidaceae bacterium]MCL2613534.1 hypothetical protein [Nocardioidaceae bacterium]
MTTRIATANVLYKLPRYDARHALDLVLAEEPDLVGLQEWYVVRLPLLRPTGSVRVAPGPVTVPGGSRFQWVTGLGGGNVVGARADRYDLLASRQPWLSLPGPTDRTDRLLNLEPPREATVGVFADREAGDTVALISYHLVSGAVRGASYRSDRPRLVRRHRHEVARLDDLVGELQADGHRVYAVGDSNHHLQRLTGLTSAWEDREPAPTCGRQTLDDVHGPGDATGLRLVTTPSDHLAVVVDRP